MYMKLSSRKQLLKEAEVELKRMNPLSEARDKANQILKESGLEDSMYSLLGGMDLEPKELEDIFNEIGDESFGEGLRAGSEDLLITAFAKRGFPLNDAKKLTSRLIEKTKVISREKILKKIRSGQIKTLGDLLLKGGEVLDSVLRDEITKAFTQNN